MAITSYTELKTAILAWSARSDLSSTIQDEVIDMAESMFKRAPEPRNSPMMGGIRAEKTRATGTFTTGTATLTLPTDFLEGDRLRVTGATGWTLSYVGNEYLGQYKDTANGAPQYYSIQDVIEFNCPPDSDYAYELSYWPSFDALSSNPTTNWLLTNYPDVYLSACLYFVGQYTMDNEMTVRWGQAYREGAFLVNKAYRNRMVSQGPVNSRVVGSTP